MKILDNINHTVREDLQDTMQKGSRVSIAAACFSIYAYQELKKQLEEIAELRFIFTSPTFVQENTPKERREFYIPKLTREKSLYGTEFEVRLRNELTQKALAKECADWVRRKVKFRSNVSGEQMPGFMTVGESSYMPISRFTTVDLGCERGNNAYYPVQRTEAFENGRYFLSLFDEIWNDSSRLQDVTDIVLQSISTAYRENSPDFIYFFTLYNIFSEFLEDVSEDNLPNEATGFKQSKIWNMLYDFQRDAALAIIHKLEQYNGCILADSVGLGKTFTALAVIKYYENRNKSVLVLCPKKLAANWNIYKGNYVNNPLVEDRFRYDVLYHTDLSRSGGTSNGIDLAALNWGNFDLVVIDESHNFRNGSNTSTDEKENRQMGMYDEDENRLFKNNDSNGRFHSDWCSMMYSRLMLARNLLTDDGVIFISVDEHEVENLRKIGEEIYGEENFVAQLVIVSNLKGRNDSKNFAICHEYLLVFGKHNFSANGLPLTEEQRAAFNLVDENGNRYQLRDLRKRGNADKRSDRPLMYFPIYYNKETKEISLSQKENFIEIVPRLSNGEDGRWRWGKDRVQQNLSIIEPNYSERTQKWNVNYRIYLDPKLNPLDDTDEDEKMSKAKTVWSGGDISSDVARRTLKALLGCAPFDFPKSVALLEKIIQIGADKDSVILDFFAGSSTTAHAVMDLNAIDSGHRKFIMVQLPEQCDKKSEAYKNGYKNVSDIGKERIRRAGDKLYETLKTSGKDYQHIAKNINTAPRKTFASDDGQTSFEVPMIPARWSKTDETAENQKLADSLDIGFRVFKLDDTNMKDVYYSADEYSQTNLEDLESNIKEDRTDLDLLFGCLLDWGLPLSMPYRSEKIDNCTVHTYAPGDAALNVPDALIACFDSNVPENVIKEIAKRKPRRAVFRDSSFASSPEKINVFEIFKLYAPDTDVKVI